MRLFRHKPRHAIEIGMFTLLLLLVGIANGQISQELQQGEKLVVLDVENMT